MHLFHAYRAAVAAACSEGQSVRPARGVTWLRGVGARHTGLRAEPAGRDHGGTRAECSEAPRSGLAGPVGSMEEIKEKVWSISAASAVRCEGLRPRARGAASRGSRGLRREHATPCDPGLGVDSARHQAACSPAPTRPAQAGPRLEGRWTVWDSRPCRVRLVESAAASATASALLAGGG